jgi:hypothetical protein
MQAMTRAETVNSKATAGGLFGICRAFSAPERNDILAHAMRRYLKDRFFYGRVTFRGTGA